jgi:hypothetical protein
MPAESLAPRDRMPWPQRHFLRLAAILAVPPAQASA